jgi:hypothetical protein
MEQTPRGNRMRKLTPREAIARAFPNYDHQMADRLISWLDQCGYQIVEKDPVGVVPPDPSEDGLSGQEAEMRHHLALT